MTTLQHQLAQLAHAAAPAAKARRSVASLLFETAAQTDDLDFDAFFAIGCSGLAGLARLDAAAFAPFADSLFAETLKRQDRALLAAAENAALDSLVAKFCAQAAPRLLHPSAFKALEWLIKRFRINEFNIDTLMRLALPFHDTWQFARILSTIKLPPRWAWLSAQKGKKVPLDRATLVQRCKIDISLVEFICDMMEKMIIPNGTNASLCSFFTGTMIEFISTVQFNDDLMRIVLPCLFAMAAMPIGNVQAAAYMVMSHLSNHLQFSAPVIVAMTDVIVDRAKPDLGKFAACCLVSIYDVQENCPKISEESLEVLLSESSFWRATLAEVLGLYQGDALTLAIVASFFQLRKQQHAGKATYSEFADFIHTLTLTAPLAEKICGFILDDALHMNPATTASPADVVALKKLLVSISKSFPLVVNSSIASLSASTKQQAGAEQLFELISSAFVGTAHEPVKQTNTTLYLSVQHADDEIRFLGYERLVKIISSQNITAKSLDTESDFAFIPQALASALTDSNLKIRSLVVNSVANLVEFLVIVVPESQGVKALYELSHLTNKNARSNYRAVFNHLLKLDQLAGREYPDAKVYAMAYFMLGKESVNAFVYASGVVAEMKKSNGDKDGSLFALLFDGTDALAKEIQQAEKTHKGKSADMDPILDDIAGRIVALIAANAVKDSRAFNALVEILNSSSSTTATRLLSWAVLSKIVESPQYSEYLLTASHTLLKHAKEFLLNSSSALDELTPTAFPTALPSLKPSELQHLENVFALSSVSVVVSQLPRLKKLAPTAAAADELAEHEVAAVERETFEILMSVRKVKGIQGVLGSFFEGYLKQRTLPFLANLALSKDVLEATQAQSLRLVTVLLNAEVEAKLAPSDYQVLIPSLLVALTRPSKVIREQAVKCLKVIKQIQGAVVAAAATAGSKKAAAAIFAFDTFFGASSNKVKFLLPDLTNKFVASILETSQELVSDSTYIHRRLSDILFNKKSLVLDQTQSENVLTFLLTTVLALPTHLKKYELLNTLKNVHVPQKVKILQPLFDAVYGNGEQANLCSSEDELSLRFAMMECFSAANNVNTVFGYRSGRFLSLFLRILATSTIISAASETVDRESIHVLGLIDQPWFASVVNHHPLLFATLVQVSAMGSKNVALAAKKTIKLVQVNADVVLTVILACKSEISGAAEDMEEQRGKRARSDGSESVSGVNELITVLELLDATSNITNRGELIGPLFELLGFVLPFDGSRIPVSLEYMKQLLITAKLNIIKSLKEVGATVDESIIRVDLIVSCIRVSDNPQTHNEALLLLAELADVYPNTVLLNVVPIFTFMGANVLRRDDDYSFHVIQQTLEAIIPPLIKKSKSSTTKKLDVKSIIEVFIDSIFHIPKHRRLRLFTILVSTLGPVEFLDSVIMMLLLKSSQRFSDIAMVNPSDIAALSPFCLSLVHQFESVVQIKTVVAITEAVEQLSVVGNDGADATVSELIGSVQLDVRGFASNEIKHFKLICLDFVNNVLGALVESNNNSKVPRKNKHQPTSTTASDVLEEKDSLYHAIFQTTLVIIVETLGTKPLLQQQQVESKNNFYRSLSKRLNSILSHLNQLMSFTSFFELALSLLEHQDVSIRIRVTDLTRDKLAVVDEATYKQNSQVINSVFTTLCVAVGEGESSTENISLKLSAFECVKSMLEKFSGVEPQVFAAVLPVLTEDGILGSESRQIQLAALECIGSCISTLGPRLIPYIKKIMTTVFKVLKDLGESLAVDQLCVTALGCADLAISVMPQFLSPFVAEILQCMFLPYDRLTGGKEVLNKFRNTKRDISSNISKKIPVRTLIPILATQVVPCFKIGAAATLELFEVSSMTISNMEKGDLTVFMNDLVKFFLSSFEFRKKYHAKYSESDIEKVEGAIISAFLQLVLRLNESHFKPLFFKIVDWAFNSATAETTSNTENILFLYRLIVNLLDKLKTIFSPYVLHLIDHSIDLLNSFKGTVPAVEGGTVDKRWELIVSSLHKFLQYSSGPVTEEVFNKLSKCLTGQIDLVSVHGKSYLNQMTRHVVPTIGLLAVNIAKEPMWKILNKEVMKKSRNDDVMCRIVTVKALQEFYVQLGEEFLILLPETVPTIAELMEDGDERVQIACQELTAEIQKHLGEDLNSYFA